MKKVKIAVTQEIIEGFQNFKKDVTTDIQENKSKQVEHFLLVPDSDPGLDPDPAHIKIYVFRSSLFISVWMVQISHEIS